MSSFPSFFLVFFKKQYKRIINKAAAFSWKTIFRKLRLSRDLRCSVALLVLKAMLRCVCRQCCKQSTLHHVVLS